MKKRLHSYVRTHRRRWGLSQRELAYIIGVKDRSVIARLELYKGRPSLSVGFALFVLFGTRAAELFPALYEEVEKGVMARAYDLYEELQGSPARLTRAKLDFLEELFKRAKDKRDPEPHV